VADGGSGRCPLVMSYALQSGSVLVPDEPRFAGTETSNGKRQSTKIPRFDCAEQPRARISCSRIRNICKTESAAKTVGAG
jgi:hypothetical protein